MANQEHVELLKRGVDEWNQWRENNPDLRPDLREINLTGLDLREVKLREVDLSGAVLCGANLSGVDLSKSVLYGANLSKVDLRGVDLSRINLRGGSLRGANLSRALLKRVDRRGGTLLHLESKVSGTVLSEAYMRESDLYGFDLSEANLSGANLSGAILSGANLTGVNLQEANLSGADLSGIDLSSTILSGAKLYGAKLHEAKLHRANLREVDLREIDLRETNLSGVDLSEVDLTGFDLTGVNLTGSNLKYAILTGVNLSGANLSRANLSGANLSKSTLSDADCYKTRFMDGNLSDANLERLGGIDADFRGANLYRAGLHSADLTRADLRDVNLRESDLKEANFCASRALRTDFTGAIFTGACLEDWNINSATTLEGVVCDHIYLQENHQERRPHGGSFQLGEFTQRFQKFLETVDLFFVDGVDWKAFLSSFQDLQAQYSTDELTVQGIERKSGGGFEVRLAVSPGADKAAIEQDAYQKYEENLQRLEAQYRTELAAKDGDIQRYQQKSESLDALLSANRQHNADLTETIKLLANRPITIEAKAVAESRSPKYDLSSAQFGGGFAENVQRDQVGGTINNPATETLFLAEAAAEIQDLLKQLEASNPSPTQAQQTAYLDAMIPPTKRERFIGALRAAGGAAIEEVPYGSVLKALVEGWQKPNG